MAIEAREWIRQAQARADAATEGPWEATELDSGHSRFDMDRGVITADIGDRICSVDGLERSRNERWAMDDGAADSEFIASVRTDAPAAYRALIAALDALETIGSAAEACSAEVKESRMRDVEIVRSAIVAHLKCPPRSD